MVRMARVWMVAMGLAGCASSARVERAADRHQARAEQASAEGDVAKASKEQKKANKLASKANTRGAFEDVLPIFY
jgi:outer membrane murein-binding lipoprotein Lpp